MKTIVTIGDGIAAWCLHHALKNKTDLQIINISANDFFAPCSYNTTSMNCLRGTRAGVSKLGDTIRRSWFFFEKFFANNNPDGIVEGYEYQILEAATIEKWERRYPEFLSVSQNDFLNKHIQKKTMYAKELAYFINPLELKNWLHSDIQNISYEKGLVTKIEKKNKHYEVKTISDVIIADKVVLCTNHMTPELADNINEKFAFYLKHCKPVSGSYLQLNGAQKYGLKWNETFNLAIEKYHFIYRHLDDQIQIGMTSNNRDTCEIPKSKQLQEIYQFIDTYTQFELPAYTKFEERSGIRFKGYYRLPFWGNIDDAGMYAICGLYKNAFTYGFQAADDLCHLLRED